MRILAHHAPDGLEYGLIRGDAVLPIPGATSVVSAWAATMSGGITGDHGLPLDALRLASPVTPIRNLFCVGWNYDDHFAEGAGSRAASAPQEVPDQPTYFTKATGTVIGPTDVVERHADVTERLDWEVELAVVIGRGGRDIPESRAIDHVLGFTIANDVSARDVQRAHGGQWFRGKSLDRTCPIGPWVVTPDELGDLADRPIRCRIDGETVQAATLGDMHFGIEHIIANLSRGLTLIAGDVILTGTPSGVGFARTPPRFLASGDVIESEIEGIGTMRNAVGR